jgi:hypothetical protein
MNIDKILHCRLINKAELSRLIWPGAKDAEVRLWQKANNTKGQRLTEKDLAKIEMILKELLL